MDSATPTPARFHEMASALQELGMSTQDMGNAELLARNLRRHGFSETAADFAVIRMRRRQEVLAELEQMVRRAQPFEEWVRALTVESPPPWRKIFKLTWTLLWIRWRPFRG